MRNFKMDLVTICIIVIVILTSNLATLFFGCTFLVSKFKQDALLLRLLRSMKKAFI